MKKKFMCVFCCLDWTLGLKFANVQLQWIERVHDLKKP